ncbi:C40 family peptidase [Actinoplanes friuliensis]|uniref:Gamma-DL-glutamyl hydrolase n=1 Tax=Actinoplanes friuliensis DSM 7358 TaxID=1246995 RepID=U5WF86_9ACTN|nr:NlpC/P60 family protein [Actinoplanes friuliensis]AGZ46700.1 Gamma-DL-glutamyl hydrolase [Actinoplanes friuliensis DSM 7358]
MQTPVPVAAPAVAVQQPSLDQRSVQRSSRSAARRSATRPAAVVLRAAQRSAARQTAKILTVRREAQARRVAAQRRAAAQRAIAARRAAASRPAAVATRSRAAVKPRAAVKRRAAVTRHRTFGRTSVRMTSVIAYARSQVGKNYRRGGEGPNSFDCSGFTKRAYARAGLRLPHSSGAQAARARVVSRAAARPGDLVVGPGHVGIYMGGGMMIDAGNSRTGVVYRRLYDGLHIERF